MDDNRKRLRSQSPPTLPAKRALTINEMLNRPEGALESPAQDTVGKSPATSIRQPPKAWFKTGEQLLKERHPATVPAESIPKPGLNGDTRSPPSDTKTVNPTSNQEVTAEQSPMVIDKHDSVSSNPTKGPLEDVEKVVRLVKPLAPKKPISTPTQDLPKEPIPWNNSFLSREQHFSAPVSVVPRKIPAQYGNSSIEKREPRIANSTLPSTSKLKDQSLTSREPGQSTSRIPDTRAYKSTISKDTQRSLPIQPERRGFQSQRQTYNAQRTPQHVLPLRPSTPGGTVIMLPANSAMAHHAGLEYNGNVDVNRLARWARYHVDWAEYLRAGGGNEEAWWLYRQMKGLPGYYVSGWHEVYEERQRQA